MLQHTLLAFRKCYASLGETLRFVCLFTYMQSTLRRPAVENMRKALYVQYSGGLMVYYGVSIVGYWAYGSTVSEYLPKELSGPKWVKILVNAAVFVQSVVSQHVSFVLLAFIWTFSLFLAIIIVTSHPVFLFIIGCSSAHLD